MRQDECSQRMSGGKKNKIYTLWKTGQTMLPRNIARLGTRGRIDIRNPAGLCRAHYLRAFYTNLACFRTHNIQVVKQLKAIEYL